VIVDGRIVPELRPVGLTVPHAVRVAVPSDRVVHRQGQRKIERPGRAESLIYSNACHEGLEANVVATEVVQIATGARYPSGQASKYAASGGRGHSIARLESVCVVRDAAPMQSVLIALLSLAALSDGGECGEGGVVGFGEGV
jgi:hypothetical protein